MESITDLLDFSVALIGQLSSSHLAGPGARPGAPAAAAIGILMDMAYIYVIRVKGHLGQRWSDWFDRLAIYQESNGETKMSGLLSDQAALFGVLNKIQALHFEITGRPRMETKLQNPWTAFSKLPGKALLVAGQITRAGAPA